MSGVSKSTLAKTGDDEHVSTEMLAKICKALNVHIGDISEMLPDQKIV